MSQYSSRETKKLEANNLIKKYKYVLNNLQLKKELNIASKIFETFFFEFFSYEVIFQVDLCNTSII